MLVHARISCCDFNTVSSSYFCCSQFIELLDELLSLGPAGSSGTLDSLHRADFESYGGLLSVDALKHRENTAATSLRYYMF